MRRTVVVLGLIMLAVPFTLLGTYLLHNWVMFGQLLGNGPPPERWTIGPDSRTRPMKG